MAQKVSFPNVFGKWIPIIFIITIGGMVGFWFFGNAFFGVPSIEEGDNVGTPTEEIQGGVIPDDNSEGATAVQKADVLGGSGSDFVAAIGTTVDFTGWQRYKDDDYGFGVDYPKNWSYKIFDYDSQRIICMYDPGKGGDCLAVVSIDINADQGEVYDKVKGLFVGNTIIEKTASIDGLGEVQLMDVENSEDFSKLSFFTNGDNVYGVQVVGAVEEVFDALLSSIKFADKE